MWEKITIPVFAIVLVLAMIVLFSVMPSAFAPYHGKQQSEAQSSSDFLTYENTDMGISIKYPSTWEKIDNVAGSVDFLAPLTDPSDQFRELVSIYIEYLDESTTLQEYAALVDEQLELIGAKIIESKSITWKNNPAWQTIYTSNFQGTELQGLNIYSIKNNINYIISYVDIPQTYFDNLPTVETMIDSFLILEESETTGKDVRNLLQEATQLFSQQMFPDALKKLDAVLIIHPDHRDALFLKSQILIALGNYGEAEKTIDNALEQTPWDFNLIFNKAVALLGQQKFDETISTIDDYLTIAPNDSTAMVLKGMALVELGKGDEAISIIDRAIELDPNNSFTFYGKGYYFYKLKNYDEAISYYDKAIELDPTNLDFLNDKGVVFLDQGKYDEAEAIFDEILKTNPNDPFVLNNKGVILLERGDNAGALDYFDKALELNPENLLFLRNKIATLSSSGVFDLAQIAYNKILQLDPEFDEPLESITTASTSLEKKDSGLIQEKEKVPGWIKNNAKWWSEGQIGDSDFVNGIQFMIKEKIINIPNLPEQASETAEEQVPDWIRNNAGWWANGLISEDDFVNGIKYLVEHGIIKV